jgi:hypothetical protein
MKRKTSVSLSADLLNAIDRAFGKDANRSAFLEAAGWDRIAQLQRVRREARDRRLLDRHAAALNREAIDTLEYQATN